MSGPVPYDAGEAMQAVSIEEKVRAAAAKMAGDWTDLPDGHVLLKMSAALPNIIEETGYYEMYGVELRVPHEDEKACPFSTLIILQKFLRANDNHVSDAVKQLTAALKWRKEFQPRKVMDEVFDQSRFDGLGYVVDLKGVPGSPNEVDTCAFNIYGGVKDMKKTFGDLDGFIRWRVALMEITLDHLHLADAKEPIPDFSYGVDPYQAFQVHDYLSVSFLRQPSEVKAASQKTIKLFQEMYPETMAKKYFVNVPIFMQWMFSAMQIFMAKETIAKMKWMSYGAELHKDLGSSIPKAYGGTGPDLHIAGATPKYDGSGAAATASAAAAAASASNAENPKSTQTAPSATPEPVAGPSGTNNQSIDGEASPAAPAPGAVSVAN